MPIKRAGTPGPSGRLVKGPPKSSQAHPFETALSRKIKAASGAARSPPPMSAAPSTPSSSSSSGFAITPLSKRRASSIATPFTDVSSLRPDATPYSPSHKPFKITQQGADWIYTYEEDQGAADSPPMSVWSEDESEDEEVHKVKFKIASLPRTPKTPRGKRNPPSDSIVPTAPKYDLIGREDVLLSPCEMKSKRRKVETVSKVVEKKIQKVEEDSDDGWGIDERDRQMAEEEKALYGGEDMPAWVPGGGVQETDVADQMKEKGQDLETMESEVGEKSKGKTGKKNAEEKLAGNKKGAKGRKGAKKGRKDVVREAIKKVTTSMKKAAKRRK